jgi:hypothetical protein
LLPLRPSGEEKASNQYSRPPKRVLLEQYQATELKSALYTLATTKLVGYETELKRIADSTESRARDIQLRIDSFVLITFSVIAVLFAAVTIFVAKSEQPSWWNPVPLFLISGTALFLSASAWIRTRHEQRVFGRSIQIIVLAVLLVMTGLLFKDIQPLRSQLNDMKKQVDQLQQQLKVLSVTPVPSSQSTSTPDPPQKQAREKKLQ